MSMIDKVKQSEIHAFVKDEPIKAYKRLPSAVGAQGVNEKISAIYSVHYSEAISLCYFTDEYFEVIPRFRSFK